VLVLLVGERDTVLRLRQELGEDAEHGPVVVVAHVLSQRLTPMALGEHMLRPADRERRDRLDREATREPATLVGLVELLRRDLRRRRLVHAHQLREPRGGLRRALHHHEATDKVGVVPDPVGVARTRGVSIAYPQTATASARWKCSLPSFTYVTPLTRPVASSSSTRSTIESARISQPYSTASGRCVTSGDAFAFTLQPCRQKPR